MEEGDDRLHIVQELFALMTALSEDAADIALNGQGCDDPIEIALLAGRLREAGHRLIVIANTVDAIPLP